MIIKHRCRNGLRIIVERIPTVRSVTIGIWIGAGSRYETEENNGISHFLEHMFFKGTRKRNAREIAEAFDEIGGHVNAFTSKEYTCYYAKVLDEKAVYATEILADMFFNSLFAEDEISKERNVVLEEINMYEDSPDEVVHELLSKASFGDHALANPILGTKSTLFHFNKELLEQYRKKFYTPENVVISVAGNIDEDFIPILEKLFGSYTMPFEKQEDAFPAFTKGHVNRQKETEQSHLCIGFQGLPYHDERIYQLTVLNNLLGGSMSSRLFQEIRENRGLAYSVYSYHIPYIDTGLLTIYAGTAPSQAETVSTTIFNILHDLKDNGVSERQLESSKAQLKSNLMFSLESTNSRMSRNGKRELLLQTEQTLDDMIHRIESVTLENVQQLAQQLFTDEFSTSSISPFEVQLITS